MHRLLVLAVCVFSVLPSNFGSKLRWRDPKTLQAGDPCDVFDSARADVWDATFYYTCNRHSGSLLLNQCPVIHGVQKVFDEIAQTCLFPGTFIQYAAGSAKVGEICTFNTDCLDGMFCSSGRCSCLSTYVERDDYCYIKINPSQSGCTYNEQCTAVWPQTSCNLVTSVCDCPASTQAAETRDGWVCIDDTIKRCPLPVPATYGTTPTDLTQTSIYNYDGTATNAACNVGSTTDAAGEVCYTAASGGYSVSEIYDCITDVTGTAPAGICCPSRALACIQPQVTSTPVVGTVLPSEETRWWYNSVTGVCEQFIWVTTGPGNANNFKTREHCQSYCKDTCSRGPPQYQVDTNVAFQQNKPLTCSSGTVCDNNHDCTTIGSFQYCCPTSSNVCSKDGGLAPRTTQTTNFDSGTVSTSGAAPLVRYYFNRDINACQQFSYNGAAGNMNNFLSASDCENYCDTLLCSQGSPIKDASGVNQQCSSDSACPSTFSCNNGVCCPRPQTVCAEPKQIGTCNRFVQRYWYNAVTKECELFTYSGCQGNDNNFDTLIDCQNYCRNTKPEPQCIQGEAFKDANANFYTCSNSGVGNLCPANYECYFDGFVWGCCPSQSYTCSLTFSAGVTCGPKSIRWYYDASTQACQTFEYLGCNGNSNKFPNRALCENYCGVGGCPYGGEPYRESADNTIRICSTSVTCPSTHECVSTLTGGSQVNYCCPTRGYICEQPPNQSQNCGGTVQLTRYYYNSVTNLCNQFQYYGCADRSSNNFATMTQCSDFCASAACAIGQTVYINPNSQQALTCNIALDNSCPTGYTCTRDSLTNTNVCCGATDAGVCPTGESAFIDAYSAAPRECLPNVVGTCYSQYLCRFKPGLNKYYCCKPSSYCPSDRALFRDINFNNEPTTCTLSSVVNTCPSGYSCQTPTSSSTTSPAFQGFCCTTNPVCPGGGQYILDSNTQRPQACTVSSSINTCPSSYRCAASTTNSTSGYCCKGGSTGVCGTGQTAYVVGGNPAVCIANAANNCPTGYTCQLYQTTNTYYCCSSQAGSGCPAGTSPFTETNGQVRLCNAGSTSQCPSGFSCQYNQALNQNQCCGSAQSTDSCPSGQVSYTDTTTNQPRVCQLGQTSACPTGYNCQWSPSVSRYQCCGISAGCPNSSVAYINPSTGSVQLCSGSGSSCASGFSCQTATTGQQTCCSTGGSVTTCTSNQILINNQCIDRVNPGQPCQYANQCLGGSTCTNNLCVCAVGSTVVNNVCTAPTTSDMCPSGSTVYISSVDSQPQRCVGTIANCPSGYGCSYSSARAQYYCCSGVTEPTYRGCTIGTEYLYPNTTMPLDCQPFRGNCPSSYFCAFSSTYGTYICCSSFRRLRGVPQQTFSGYEKESKIGEDISWLFEQPIAQQRQKQPEAKACDPSERKWSGQDCCDDEQCTYGCKSYAGHARCACPRHQLLDITLSPPRCVNSCKSTSWRDGAFCVGVKPSFM